MVNGKKLSFPGFSGSQVRISEADDFFLLIRGFFLINIVVLYRAAFCRALASVCKAKLRLCVIVSFILVITEFQSIEIGYRSFF